MWCERYECLGRADGKAKPNLTVHDKLLCRNKGLLTVSDDQLPVGRNGDMWSLHSLILP